MRKLYFDIDGVFLDYDEEQRPLFCDGTLEDLVKACGFDKLVCVSGRSDMVNAEVFGRKPYLEQKDLIHQLLNRIFSDEDWFLSRLNLAYDTDDRCRHIDLNEDWWYLDDWADKFFKREHGEALYTQHLGLRVLLVDPHGDGSDVLRWFRRIRDIARLQN
jgi:hypothetical protein